jgi:hypothetical protein
MSMTIERVETKMDAAAPATKRVEPRHVGLFERLPAGTEVVREPSTEPVSIDVLRRFLRSELVGAAQ